MVLYMFSVGYCVGGTKVIKDDGDLIAWIDIFGDLHLPDSLESSTKDAIISFLCSENIEYNKKL